MIPHLPPNVLLGQEPSSLWTVVRGRGCPADPVEWRAKKPDPRPRDPLRLVDYLPVSSTRFHLHWQSTRAGLPAVDLSPRLPV